MIFFLIALLALMSACEKQEVATTTFSGIAMTIPYTITIGKDATHAQTQQIKNIISSTFNEIDTVYNKWNPSSELSMLNAAPANTPIPLSSKLNKLLALTDRVVKATKGKFDPSIEPLQQLWKRKLEQGIMPLQEEIEEVLLVVGWHHFSLTPEGIVKDDQRAQMDLSGIAKGYGVDLLVDRLKTAGYGDVLVEWGGELKAAGIHPSGRKWTFSIRQLEDNTPAHDFAEELLDGYALATSGDYLQYWTVNGTTYFHILDPQTGFPLKKTVTSIGSVTVECPSCAIADGLATALMMCSDLEEAQEEVLDYADIAHNARIWFMANDKRLKTLLSEAVNPS